MDVFVEQAGRLRETLSTFCERGGFCREHAWLFHRRAALALTGVPVAQMYEALVRRDIAHLERLELDVAKAHVRRRPDSLLGRRVCLPCEHAEERLKAKSESLVRALEEPEVQRAIVPLTVYVSSMSTLLGPRRCGGTGLSQRS